jgi:hypothetical protein
MILLGLQLFAQTCFHLKRDHAACCPGCLDVKSKIRTKCCDGPALAVDIPPYYGLSVENFLNPQTMTNVDFYSGYELHPVKKSILKVDSVDVLKFTPLRIPYGAPTNFSFNVEESFRQQYATEVLANSSLEAGIGTLSASFELTAAFVYDEGDALEHDTAIILSDGLGGDFPFGILPSIISSRGYTVYDPFIPANGFQCDFPCSRTNIDGSAAETITSSTALILHYGEALRSVIKYVHSSGEHESIYIFGHSLSGMFTQMAFTFPDVPEVSGILVFDAYFQDSPLVAARSTPMTVLFQSDEFKGWFDNGLREISIDDWNFYNATTGPSSVFSNVTYGRRRDDEYSVDHAGYGNARFLLGQSYSILFQGTTGSRVFTFGDVLAEYVTFLNNLQDVTRFANYTFTRPV